MQKFFMGLFLPVLFFSFVSCGDAVRAPASPTASISPTPTYTWGHRTKMRDCVSYINPDHDCTPGDIFPSATAAIICVAGYTKTVRNVTLRTKIVVERAYGVAYNPVTPAAFEVDHLVALELGGNNSLANLWPEYARSNYGYQQKDKVE